MKIVVREDESGISEVVGTILILAMTVVLFSTIIIWVGSIPTPSAQTRVDIQGTLTPVYAASGTLRFVNITLTHNGGEALQPYSTMIFVQDVAAAAPHGTTTGIFHLKPYSSSGTTPNGLLDGTDSVWNVGERWGYQNSSMNPADTVTITVVDSSRSVVVWSAQLNAPAGSRPAVFVNEWASLMPLTSTVQTPESGLPFYVFAQLSVPDNNLNANSVYANFSYWFGNPGCGISWPMVPVGSGIFQLYMPNSCTKGYIGMDNTWVLFNATTTNRLASTGRLLLHMIPGPTSTGGGGTGNASGRPPNLRWNGGQGYNLFNATQWNTLHYQATPTRTFKANEQVVVVVGSLTMENIFGSNTFDLWDPYSGSPAKAVVYGASKTVYVASSPSTTSAFSFFQFVNGYYIYTYTFNLNTANMTNYYLTPPLGSYYFAKYPLSMLLSSSTAHTFSASDSINVTTTSGQMRTFPQLATFSDSGYTHQTTFFTSTSIIYVQVLMLSVNSNATISSVFFGNVMIQDFAGNLQLNRAPMNGYQNNLPICAASGACGTGGQAMWPMTSVNAYRFEINLARVNQDPWDAGTQYYSLVLSSIKDSDESYSSVSLGIQVQAPLYKMDIVTGNAPATNSAWGTKDYAYFYQDYNGFDAWKKLRVDFCTGGISTSGVSGSGSTCPGTAAVKVALGDFWHDGTLGVAESFIQNLNPGSGAVEIYRRTVDATGAVVYLPVFNSLLTNVQCAAITTGDLTGSGLPSVVCGGSDGSVWYYANNGNWTVVTVDGANSQPINTIRIGDFNGDGWNDIAVGGPNGYLKWYPNLGYGKFQNTGISDNWFAVAEQTSTGTITGGSYLSTYGQDGVYEQLTEALVNVPLATGNVTNGQFNTSATSWFAGTSYNGATDAYATAVGNPPGSLQITAPFKASSSVTGYYYQPFTVTGSPPYTVTFSAQYELPTNGAAASNGAVTFYALLDTSASGSAQPGGCVVSGSGPCWTSGPLSGQPGWTSTGSIGITARVTTPGTYYLKLVMNTSYQGSGTASVGGFDNVVLTWSSTPGQTSQLQQYWQMNTLPNRIGTSYTFSLVGHRSPSSDNDNYTFAYSTNVVGTNPAAGTYTTMFTLTATSDTSYPFTLPVSVAGQTVWIRAVDTNHNVGSTVLDTLFVDTMKINANTPGGTTGVSLSNPGDGSAVNSLSAMYSNLDKFADLAVGTQAGKVFIYWGSVGGLLTPSGVWWTTPGSTPVAGVRWGNFSTNYPNLQIAVFYGSSVTIIRSDSGAVTISTIAVPSGTISAVGVGDINGDGWADVVVATSSGNLYLWENLGQGTSWTSAVTIDSIGATYYSMAIGASTNSQFVGSN